MHFVLRAVPEEAFAQWIASARQAGPALDRAGYVALSAESQNVSPFTYRSVDPNLFHAVVTQEVPPGPGPHAGRGGPTVHPRAEH
jgi:cytochrome o ubiquinol oxidase subunit 2